MVEGPNEGEVLLTQRESDQLRSEPVLLSVGANVWGSCKWSNDRVV